MLKVIAAIIWLIPFILGIFTVLGLVFSYFSDEKRDVKIEIRIEDKMDED